MAQAVEQASTPFRSLHHLAAPSPQPSNSPRATRLVRPPSAFSNSKTPTVPTSPTRRTKNLRGASQMRSQAATSAKDFA